MKMRSSESLTLIFQLSRVLVKTKLVDYNEIYQQSKTIRPVETSCWVKLSIGSISANPEILHHT